MALKEILDKIQATLPADAGAELTSLLADAKREATSILADISAANAESKERRIRLNEATAELDTVKGKLADATKPNPELDSLKKKASEYDAMLEKRNAESISRWQEKQKVLTSITASDTDKRKDKIAALLADFTIPAEGETLTPDMAEANLRTYGLLEKAGAFETPQDTGTPFQRKSGNVSDATPNYKSGGHAIASLLYGK